VIRPELFDVPAEQPRSHTALGTLVDVEREHIMRVLVATEGNKAKAARMLGVSRPRLDRLIWKHGIGPHE
jgi:transcriptional regulator with GAF, ATPase, and Fis domain